MSLQQVAEAHHRRQVALARRAADLTDALWKRIDQAAIRDSWLSLVTSAYTAVASAQGSAVAGSGLYIDDALGEQGRIAEAAGQVRTEAFAGIASDGRDLQTLLYRPAITTLTAIGQDAPVTRALAAGRFELNMIVRTQVADAGRAADGVAITARPQVTGYVRMLSPPSCSRCVVLAGRWYRWNAGFQRHPCCDCRHIPASENASDVRTSPKKAFESLSPTEQDRVFTKAGAQAIRDGSDISQVVNARRGAAGLSPAGARLTGDELRMLRGVGDRGRLESRDVFGQPLFTTTEGATGRGLAGGRLGARTPRLMPESIYQIADGDRDEAIRLLRRNGYIT